MYTVCVQIIKLIAVLILKNSSKNSKFFNLVGKMSHKYRFQYMTRIVTPIPVVRVLVSAYPFESRSTAFRKPMGCNPK